MTTDSSEEARTVKPGNTVDLTRPDTLFTTLPDGAQHAFIISPLNHLDEEEVEVGTGRLDRLFASATAWSGGLSRGNAYSGR